MKRNLILASAIVLATLASCTKISELDPGIESATTAQTAISFSTYASTAATTKGTAVNSNSDFQTATTHGSFSVMALASDCDFTLTHESEDETAKIESFTMLPENGSAEYYFGSKTVSYDSSKQAWVNGSSMYWPNASKVLHFAAYSPSDAAVTYDDATGFSYSTADAGTTDTYSYTFDYAVKATTTDQEDLMYAMTQVNYLAPSDQTNYGGDSYITTGADTTPLLGDTNAEDAVNLHFKHALTQIAFTATKDDSIDVKVNSITICNVYNSGTFTATAITDDSDTSTSSTDSSTVGDSGNDGDKVNANNFGSWAANYEGSWTLVDPSDETQTITVDGTDTSLARDGYTAADGGYSAMSNYTATMASTTAIEVGTTATQLTSTTDVLMLMPQTLTAWVPSTSPSLNYVGSYNEGGTAPNTYEDGRLSDGNYANPSMNSSDRTLTYLAIDCEITHYGSTVLVHEGYIFVPFETSQIDYSKADVDNPETTAQDAWLPGYKITYCLNFGGGYVVEEGHTDIIPEPGCVPDTDTYTLRTITYTTTIDTFVDSEGSDGQDMNDYDTTL